MFYIASEEEELFFVVREVNVLKKDRNCANEVRRGRRER